MKRNRTTRRTPKSGQSPYQRHGKTPIKYGQAGRPVQWKLEEIEVDRTQSRKQRSKHP